MALHRGVALLVAVAGLAVASGCSTTGGEPVPATTAVGPLATEPAGDRFAEYNDCMAAAGFGDDALEAGDVDLEAMSAADKECAELGEANAAQAVPSSGAGVAEIDPGYAEYRTCMIDNGFDPTPLEDPNADPESVEESVDWDAYDRADTVCMDLLPDGGEFTVTADPAGDAEYAARMDECMSAAGIDLPENGDEFPPDTDFEAFDQAYSVCENELQDFLPDGLAGPG